MSSQIPHSSRLENRPLVDLTHQIDRDPAVQPVACGAFGNVYKCRLRDTLGCSSLVAVKTPRYFLHEDTDEDRKKLDKLNKDLRRELGILKRLGHENIVPLLGVADGFGPTLAVVLPWMQNGTLHSFLRNKILSVTDRLHLLQGIGSGLEYLHSERIFHGDLHSGNVLIDEEHKPRISDFGLACTVERLQPGLSYLQRFTNNPGAARSAAPERLNGGNPHPSGDIYSFGCIMFEVLSGDAPWKEMNEYQVIVLKLTAHRPPSRPVHATLQERHWALMAKCWSTARRRPTAHDIVVAVQAFCLSNQDVDHNREMPEFHILFFFFSRCSNMTPNLKLIRKVQISNSDRTQAKTLPAVVRTSSNCPVPTSRSMATLVRMSKSGSDWTPNDLLAYNIRVEYQDAQTFFGVANLPQPRVDDEILIAPDAAATQHDDPYTLLRTMDLAMETPHGEESAVIDFAVQLFKVLGYTGRALDRVARTRKDLPFLVCGEQRHARTDICVMDASDIFLIVQEDKRHMDGPGPEPLLIAEAIAAFDNNNDMRIQALGLPTLQKKTVPGITMMGTMPIFYKISVTAELVRAVQLGDYPAHETVVYAHLPMVPRPARRYSEGMKPLDNRHVILSCYEAFKQFL